MVLTWSSLLHHSEHDMSDDADLRSVLVDHSERKAMENSKDARMSIMRPIPRPLLVALHPCVGGRAVDRQALGRDMRQRRRRKGT